MMALGTHPTIRGARQWVDIDGVAKKFHELTKAQQPKSQLNCFLMAMAGTGLIASGKTGRYDQYPYADAIYAGMVRDLRLSSHVQDTSKLLGDFIRKAVSGTSRGKGRVPFTRFIVTKNATVNDYIDFPNGDGLNYGAELQDEIFCEQSDGTYAAHKLSSVGANQWATYGGTNGLKVNGSVVLTKYILTPEFDSLPYVNLICDPVHGESTFPNGCIGEWLPQIPPIDPAIGYSLTREAASSSGVITFTDNDGESWTSVSQPIDIVRNVTKDTSGGANFVGLLHYESLSDPTEAANNSVVVGEVGKVWSGMANYTNYGNRLLPSLIDEIGKDSGVASTSVFSVYNPITQYVLWDNNKLPEGSWLPTNAPTHQPIGLTAPTNNSPAVKALYTLTEKDGLLYGQFHGCSMSHNGNDWGDDGKIPIVNKEGTKTDDNGVTQKTFCHHTKFPLGIASYNDSSQSTK